MRCTNCELHKSCSSVLVEADGTGKVLFLGEAPGKEEDERNRPFVGASGQLLRETMSRSEIPLEDMRFSNAVRCRPKNNKTPGIKNVRACSEHLLAELEKYETKIIVPLGNTPLKALREIGLLKVQGTISPLNGSVIHNEEHDITIIPCFHPAFVLRDHENHAAFLKALIQVEKVYLEGVPKKKKTHYKITDKLQLLKIYIEKCKVAGFCAYDIETSALHPKQKNAEFICFALSCKEGEGLAFNLNKNNYQSALTYLHSELLENPDVLKIIHHAKFELMWSMSIGRTINNFTDTMLIHWHINEKRFGHGLKKIASNYTDLGFYDAELELYKEKHPECNPEKTFENEKGEIVRGSYANFPRKMLLHYNCMDVDACLRIYNNFKGKLDRHQIWVLNEVQIPSCYPLAEMELEGSKIDLEYLEDLKIGLKEALEETEKELFTYPEVVKLDKKISERKGKEGSLNLNSPIQLRELIFVEMGLPTVFETPTGLPSTSAEVLNKYAEDYPLIQLILDHREFSKLLSTFVEGIRKRKLGSYVHTHYHMTGTETGRYASSDPNLQNIPRKDYIKDLWIPEKGHIFAQGDYSQLELRIMAVSSQDETLIDYYNEDVDVHRYIAARIHGCDPEKITKEQRTMAKRTVFGLCYGQSPMGLAQELNISTAEAEEFVTRFFEEFPKVKFWMDKTKRFLIKNGYVKTLFGRRRRLDDHKSSDYAKAQRALRQGINAPIQGTAADILAYTQPRVWRFLKEKYPETKMILTVHDSLCFSIPEKYYKEAIPKIKKIMQTMPPDIPQLKTVEFKVDFETGKSWGSLKNF